MGRVGRKTVSRKKACVGKRIRIASEGFFACGGLRFRVVFALGAGVPILNTRVVPHSSAKIKINNFAKL
jgi:hypothetical protein